MAVIGTGVIFIKIKFNDKVINIDLYLDPFLPGGTTTIEETERDTENNKLIITKTSSCRNCHRPIKTKFSIDVPEHKLPCTDLLEQLDTIAICHRCTKWQHELVIVKIRESWF